MDDKYNGLEQLRAEIDRIDETLLDLFQQRMATVLEIAAYKKKNALPVLDQGRERIVLEKTKRISDQNLIGPAARFLNELMAISRDIQTAANQTATDQVAADQTVANRAAAPDVKTINSRGESINTEAAAKRVDMILGYQGLPGSYGEQALLGYFGHDIQAQNVESFEDIFLALCSGQITYGILPIENSSTGGISEVYDLLCQYGFYITGEKSLGIEHHLLGLPGADIDGITDVFSHPQGFEQCSDFLKTHPHWHKTNCGNTAVSAKMVADCGDVTKAAIASKRAADIYGLKVMAAKINTNKTNFTRFIIIGRQLEVAGNADKISLAVSIKHEPGSLHQILSHIAGSGLSMLKIESRPIPGKPWEYLFYIDLQGNLADPKVLDTVKAIQSDSTFYQLLGNYRADHS